MADRRAVAPVTTLHDASAQRPQPSAEKTNRGHEPPNLPGNKDARPSQLLETHQKPTNDAQANVEMGTYPDKYPADSKDTDLEDWLQMTEYHDTEYRKRKLARFRKRRELDRQRAELEREDQLEEVERAKSMRSSLRSSSSILSSPNISSSSPMKNRPSFTFPSAMRPPPTPLRITTGSLSDSVGTRPSPGAQPNSAALKRQRAEADVVDPTVAGPVEKLARFNLNSSESGNQDTSPRERIKREPNSATFTSSIPLEKRIRAPTPDFRPPNYNRGRSRSPYEFGRGRERYRSRDRDGDFDRDRPPLLRRRTSSYSPRRYGASTYNHNDRYAPPVYTRESDRAEPRSCFYCHDTGHSVSSCPERSSGDNTINAPKSKSNSNSNSKPNSSRGGRAASERGRGRGNGNANANANGR